MTQQHPDNGHDAHEGHPPHLAHHFETPAQQYESGKQGMWIFLGTEVLLFGGLFCAYAVYRAHHPEIFFYGSQYLDKVLGGINTAVLICSSLTMAMAVHFAQRGMKGALVLTLVLTLLCACGFLGIKYVEYKQKWQHGLLPGEYYNPGEHGHGDGHAATQVEAGGHDQPTTLPQGIVQDRGQSGGHHLEDEPRYVQIFFGIYFAMTGLHGLHVLGGMIAITWVLVLALRGKFTGGYFAPVDNVGLYWHLVDLIWIFLFPMLYLIH